MYTFTYDETKSGREHYLAAEVTASEGDRGDYYTPPSGPEIEIDSKKVAHGSNFRYHSLVYMVNGKKRRLLSFDLANEIADWLIENQYDEMLESESFDFDAMRAEAQCERAEARRDALLDR
jgi:hypothetical protein